MTVTLDGTNAAASAHKNDLRGEGAVPIPTVVIVSDIRLLREALTEILRRESALSIVGVSASIAEARVVCRDGRPNVVLLDAALPGALTAVAAIKAFMPNARVVALAVAEAEDNVLAWGEAGVAGYIPRTASVDDLVAALGSVLRGEQTCSARVAARLLRRLAEGPDRSRPGDQAALTIREAEIVQLLAVGLCNKEIARRLHIGLATTKSHVHNLLTKFGLTRRGQAAVWLRHHSENIAGGS